MNISWGQFADAEGKKGGQFYTPRCIVELLVEMLEPYQGRIYDPACGSGGMFVQSEKFVEKHGGKIGDISVYGQESNQTTWKLCNMNLAIRGIDSNIQWGDTFHDDKHSDLKADFVIANPPFNDSDWKGEQSRKDIRWDIAGVPPTGNANFAWVQHFIHHLAPHGVAGFVLANGSLSSNSLGEGEIRKNLIEKDLVDCIVALPPQLFYNTQIPACLWFVSRARKNHKFRNRTGETLFIDARKLGVMLDTKQNKLTQEDIAKIAKTYHAWRGEKEQDKYSNIQGFCKAAKLEEVRKHGHILTPGRYVGTEEVEDDGEPFEDKMKRLTQELAGQFKESSKLELEIKKNLEGLGWRL